MMHAPHLLLLLFHFHHHIHCSILFCTCSTLPDQLEDFGLFHFPLLHALLHRGDDAVGLILGTMLRALLSGPCKAHKTRWWIERWNKYIGLI